MDTVVKSLVANRLSEYDLEVSAGDPIIELAPGVAVLFPRMLTIRHRPAAFMFVNEDRT
jgi:phospholipid N-methyltransferase